MRILVIRFSSIGDIILTTPVLSELKGKYPGAKIDFLVLDKFKDAISGNKNLNKVIVFDKEAYRGIDGIKRFAAELEKNKYDMVIDLHSKIRSKALTYFMGVKTYRYKKRKFWKTILVKLRLIKYSVDDTIVKNYFGAVKSLGVIYKGEKLEFNFSMEDMEKVGEYGEAIVFAPGASKNTKKWTKENFANLAVLLKERYQNDILLVGGKNEKKDLDEINQLSGGVCTNLAGKLSLKESGALLSKSFFLVTNDSGPFHIGRGVGAKCFVIFGPTDPGMFEYGEKSILIYKDERCSPCSLHGDEKCPKGHFKCMKDLNAEGVFKVIEESMG